MLGSVAGVHRVCRGVTRSTPMPKAPDDGSSAARPVRSDAAANRECLLAAAAIAYRREGERVPMATIAQEAGVGVGTLYRHYPTRRALLAALVVRSFRVVLDHARAAAASDRSALAALAEFFEQTIAARDDLILPLHGGPVIPDQQVAALRTEIRQLLEQVLARGQRNGTIRADITAGDIIITGAMLAQPLPHVSDWDELAGRQARIYVAGLATTPGRLRVE
jgi:AcrR family transcriptional regulator